jgi:hypothetical protein
MGPLQSRIDLRGRIVAPVKKTPTTPALILAVAVALLVLVGRGTFASELPLVFEDVTARSGIKFVLRNSVTPKKHQIETMPGGVAVFDFDNDGYPDIYFTNGAPQPSLKKSGPEYSNRLYRNKGDWTFEDVTEKAGVAGNGYDIGVAAADFDNDGYVDLFVAGVRGNTLYRNLGNGRFEDVTRRSGISSSEWAVSAAWLDFDNDGRLDLFVVNYVKWDPLHEPFCGDGLRGIATYCHPRFYAGTANQLYHNNGNGTFTDVSQSSGIAAAIGKGMGVAIADYDHDGRMDIFVANDTVPNFLFHNQGNGTFREVALRAGVALNDDGKAVSSMGSDFRDIDNDGREDLFVTALANETFPYFRNLGRGLFGDATYPSKIGRLTSLFSGWGLGIYDFNNDGWKDVFIANGDVQDNSEMISDRKSRQQNLLLLNDAHGGFLSRLIGAPAQHRGAAFGDFDRDGRIDAVVTRLNEPPLLLRNVTPDANHWLAIELSGRRSNRSAIGARVTVETDSGTQVNHVSSAVGYASSSDLVVHFGLGTSASVRKATIEWPSGVVQTIQKPQPDHYLVIREEGESK